MTIKIDKNAIANSINAGLRAGMQNYVNKANPAADHGGVAALVRKYLDNGDCAVVSIKTRKVIG